MGRRDEFVLANVRAAERLRTTPHAVSAKFDRAIGKVVIALSSGVNISFQPEDAEELSQAPRSALNKVEITPSGLGLYFPLADADISIPGLLEGFLGSKAWAAARMGEAGGKARSAAKRAASRANGQLGGRPRKIRKSA